MNFLKQSKTKILLLMVVVAILVGFASGVAGELFARSFVFDYLTDNVQISELNNLFYELLAKYDFLSEEEKDSRLEIVIRKPEINGGLGIVQEVTAGDFVDNLGNSTVALFAAKKVSSQDILFSSYQSQDALGRGFVLTNDGWIVTTNQVLSSMTGSYVAVTSKGEVFEIRKIVNDPLTETVFAKIEISNAAILGMAQKASILPGQPVVVLDEVGGVMITSVKNSSYRAINKIQDRVISSDELDSYYLLADGLDSVAAGEPVVDAGGRVVGLVVNYDRQKAILPANNFASEVDEVLRDGEISRVSLGVNYLDLQQLVIDPQINNNYRDLNRGALIYKNTTWGVAGVERNSPAAAAGLEVGQVILKVEGEEVNSQTKLGQLIQEYDVGQNIDLTVWDGEQEKVVNVTLAELK